MGTKAQIVIAAFALMLPVAMDGRLQAGDLAAQNRAIEPVQVDTLPPALPDQPARAQDRGLSLPPAGRAAPGLSDPALRLAGLEP